MGVAYAVKSGDMQLSDVDVAYRDKVESLVDGMTKKDLKKYAETKHDGLPETVTESISINEDLGLVEQIIFMIILAANVYDGSISKPIIKYFKNRKEIKKIVKRVSANKDLVAAAKSKDDAKFYELLRDTLTDDEFDTLFKVGANYDKVQQGVARESVDETVQGTAITPNQIGGMGPVLLPTDGNVGSGDVPTGPQVADIDDDEEKKKQKGTKKKLEMENLYTSFNEFLNEATDINDPVLMAMRAKRMEIEKAKALPKKRKLTPKQEQNILDSIWDIDTELKELRQERSQIFADMEAEAGQMDYAEFEEQGLHNHYGDLLNGVDEKIAKLKAKKQQLELKLV